MRIKTQGTVAASQAAQLARRVERPVEPVGTVNAQGRPDAPAADRARLQRAAEQLNQTAALIHRDISFQVHEGTGRLQVRVIDQREGEVVAEFPPEKLLDLLAAIEEQVGLILDRMI